MEWIVFLSLEKLASQHFSFKIEYRVLICVFGTRRVEHLAALSDAPLGGFGVR